MVHSFSAFFEEKRILRRKPKRTGLPRAGPHTTRNFPCAAQREVEKEERESGRGHTLFQ